MKPSKDIRIAARTKNEVVVAPKRRIQFIPMGDKVSVVAMQNPERFVPIGGIIVDTHSVKMLGYGETTVIEAGPGCVTIKKGDRICCSIEQVREVKVGEESFFVINEMSVMALIREIRDPEPKAD